MIVIVRYSGELPAGLGIRPRLTRNTPSYADPAGGIDAFCEIDREAVSRLRAAGAIVVELRDGWYEAGSGGVAVWGNGRHWEIRDTPFTVSERSD